MNFVTWSIRNPVPVVMLFVALVLGGLYSFPKLAIQDQPDIEFQAVIITVSYPGVPPSQMETEITRKVEDSLSSITGVEHINSTASNGISNTFVEFQFGYDIQTAMDDVRDALSRIRSNLPPDANEPQISRASTTGFPVISYGVSADNMTDTELSWFVDLVIARELTTVKGVGQVNRTGGVSREVRVNLDPDRMAALGVSAADVSGQLLRTQVELPGGESRIGGREQTLRTTGTIQSMQELQSLQIALADGRKVRMDSIAEIKDGSGELRQLALLNGKPVIGFQVLRSWGSGAIEVADGARKAVKDLQKQYPNVHITELNTTVDYIREAYNSSLEMLLEGAILAIIVVWIFLRDWRATLISAAALPLAIIPTFWAMELLGFSMNTLTMLALSLVVGMLVDDAIVEIENIVRHLRMGKKPLQAASDAAIEIGLAVVATTFTLCAVFVPVAFMGGIPGEFFRPFAFTATVSVLFSLLVARMLTPMMAARMMKSYDHGEEATGPVKGWYLRHVKLALHNRLLTVVIASVLMVASFSLVRYIPTGFSPANDVGFVNLSVNLPPGTALEETRATTEEIRRRISEFKEVRSVYAVIGSGNTVRNATMTIMLVPKADRKDSQVKMQDRIMARIEDVPGARLAFGGGGGAPGGSRLQIELVGEDSAMLAMAASNIEREMRGVPGLTSVNTSASLLAPELTIRPLRERAAELGVTTAAMAQVTRIATSGDILNNLPKMNLPDRQVPIRVRLNDKARGDLEQIKLLPVPARGGAVPLMNVADVSFGSGPAQITRYDRSRNITISADRGSLPLGDALKLIYKLPSVTNLPPGVRRAESGEAGFMTEIFTGFATAMIVGIFCIYALLVLLFHDVLQPITILSALPPSAGGAIVCLWLFNFELSIPALIGLLMLMGIVTKNSILLVEYAVMARREHNMPRFEALVDACSKRARPIIMTTIAMGAGMLPVAIGTAGNASFRAPMAVSVIGGLIASTALSLFVVPVIYTLFDDLENAIHRGYNKLTGRKPNLPAAEPSAPVSIASVE
jgi:hydrophobe/amphiphile efflux-1 (HAE1) family protein